MRPFRVLLCGPFRRARVGGVKTHVERLRAALLELGMNVTTIDPRAWETLRFPFRAAPVDLVHIHSTSGWVALAYTALARIMFKRVLITIHGNIGDFSWVHRAGFVMASRLGAELVILNESSRQFAVRRRLRFRVMSAFIPPTAEEKAAKRVDTQRMKDIIASLRSRSDAVFITYCYDGNIDGGDIYGIQDLIAFFAAHPQWSLVILAGTNGGMLSALELPDNVTAFQGDVTVTEIAAIVDAIVRNSKTDGDSIFVREGLYAGTAVVATSVVSRPEGVLLYELGNHDQLKAALDLSLSATKAGPMVPEQPDARALYLAEESRIGSNASA